MKKFRISPFLLIMILLSSNVLGGPLDPDCTAKKAVKSAAVKSKVGVGGRCNPAEAAKDTTKDAVGIDHSKKKKNNTEIGDDGGLAGKSVRKALKN